MKMKTLGIWILLICMFSCTKEENDTMKVTSIDQINGTWKWKSTCGGLIDDCANSSSSHFAIIEFSSDGKFEEKHNDTIYLTANFSIMKTSETYGRLILDNIITTGMFAESIEYSISIESNELWISRGELLDKYYKIK
jgi:predicted secreted protein